MNPIGIIKSIEGLIFEVLMWIILIPKTLIKVVGHPSWISQYIISELKKSKESRFDEYISPIFFLLLLNVIPYFGIYDRVDITNSIDFEKKFFLVTLFVASGPLSFSVSIILKKGKTLSKKTLRDIFYIQCYCFTPFYILLLPTYFLIVEKFPIQNAIIELLFNHEKMLEFLNNKILLASAVSSFAWLFIVEICVIKKILKSSNIIPVLDFFPIFAGASMVLYFFLVLVFFLLVSL